MKRVLFLFLVASQSCFAGARHFTFLYEAPTAAPGSFESENYSTSLFDEGEFNGMEFRHEIEIGITEHFQASIYFANWDYDAREAAAHYDSASVEFIYNFTNPVTDLAASPSTKSLPAAIASLSRKQNSSRRRISVLSSSFTI